MNVLLSLAIALVLGIAIWASTRPRPCPTHHCGYRKTPQLARPAMHHVPFTRPKDSHTADQDNQVYIPKK